jgi:hypothetical protein
MNRRYPGQYVERLASPAPQTFPKTMIEKASSVRNPSARYASPAIWVPTDDQFKKYTYPIPKEQGGTRVHMIWSDTLPHYLLE